MVTIMDFNKIFWIIFGLIYAICLKIENRALEKNNSIDTSYKRDFIAHAVLFPFAIYTLIFSYNAIMTTAWDKMEDAIFSVYFFSFMLGSVAYIIYYIKIKIYAFIPRKNRLNCVEFKSWYDIL